MTGHCRDCGHGPQGLDKSFRCPVCKAIREVLEAADAPTARERYEVAARDRRAS